MKATLTIFFMLLAALVATAQQTQDRIIDPRVHSLKVAPAGNPYTPAIITLGGGEVINVNFDLLDYDVHYLRYSVTHCDALWRPSQLVESEYVSGFNQADVTDYAQCNNTFVHYWNYNLQVPNQDMELLKSGNYVLRVYEQDDPDQVLFTARFAVSEGTVSVLPNVTSRTDVDYNGGHQQVSFELNYKNGTIRDPYNELTCVVTQNGRTDNAAVVTKPLMVSSDRLSFEHNRDLIFAAGNEYRRFETVNIHTPNMGVAAIEYFEPYYHATLITDGPRAAGSYLYDQTQMGRFTIRNAESDYSLIEADYIMTHFTLNTGEPLRGGKLLVQGEMTKGEPDGYGLMSYDASTGCYRAHMLLKQGAYNYQYLWVPDGTTVGQAGKIEGDKFQTINEYVIRVYDRPMGSRYDRLVGFAVAHSGL